MAARENQGYLIAVIILVLLSLVLALAAFLGLSKMSEYADNKAAIQKSLDAEKKVNEANDLEAAILKAFIGDLGPSAAEVPTQIGLLERIASSNQLSENAKGRVDAVLKNVKAANELYLKDKLGNVASAEGAQQEFTYRSLAKNLSTVLAKKHHEMNIAVQRAKLAEQEAETKIAAKQTEVTTMEKAVETSEADLQKEKQASVVKQTELQRSLDKSLQELQDANGRNEKYKLESDNKIGGLDGEIATLEKQNTTLKNKINVYEREVFDSPDGTVVKVASSLNTVFIDLGRADGLTANRSFVIYDQSSTNFEKDKHKATVEVINVDEHQSEARVTSEDPNDPILNGDYVLTATWDPGHSIAIALAGRFDLDHDGYSDLEKLMQMIKRNGGEVVAWNDENGNIQGEMNASIRYLVLGDSAEIGKDANPNIARAMQKMESQAEENTIQVIDLQKLLSRMGVRSKPRIERINDRGGFPIREPSDTLKAADR